jgi:hypothetical protein
LLLQGPGADVGHSVPTRVSRAPSRCAERTFARISLSSFSRSSAQHVASNKTDNDALRTFTRTGHSSPCPLLRRNQHAGKGKVVTTAPYLTGDTHPRRTWGRRL